MGICSSGPALTDEQIKRRKNDKIREKWINDTLETRKNNETQAIKLLFLGAGESGKTTMLKQMKIIHTSGFSQEERVQYITLVHQNIIASTKQLCKMSEEFSQLPERQASAYARELKDDVRKVKALGSLDKLTEPLAQSIDRIWNDQGIKYTYSFRSSYQLNDSTEYFYQRLREVVQPDYVPTEQDILRARIRTTGIVEHVFNIKENEFRMFDVGGQRNARKKWIHCFVNVTSVIFVAALSAYDQVLYEDNTTNRMHEALNLFEDICCSRWFLSTPMILFLNKKDLFKEKIGPNGPSLKVAFPFYTGANEYRPCCQFIKQEFRDRNRNPERKVYVHFTNATDTKTFEKVFTDVQSIVLRLHLIDVGLMDPTTDMGDDDQKEVDLDDMLDN